MKTVHRNPKEVSSEIYKLLKSPDFHNNEASKKKYHKLKEEQKNAQAEDKLKLMYLNIEAQNLVHKHLNKLQPKAHALINGILGQKYVNADNSINHKHKNLFQDIEKEIKKELKYFSFKMFTSVHRSHGNFILTVDIYYRDGQRNGRYEQTKYIADFENMTSFKNINEVHIFETYNLNAEIKKLQKYEAQKEKLANLKHGINYNFANQFLNQFNNDKF